MTLFANPRVTALIDTYNHQDFIEKAVQSVLEQDFPADQLEILVVDDGSTDRTPAILKRFASKIRVLTKANGGQASAFNLAIPEARGAIVAFLDGDDWWQPRKLAATVEAFDTYPQVGLVGHGIIEVFADGRECVNMLREVSRFRLSTAAAAETFRLRKCFLGTSRMAYRREVLGMIGPVPEALRFEADEYLFTLAGLFADVLVLPEPLTYYRLHGGNLFQFAGVDTQAVRKKQIILDALAENFQERFATLRVSQPISRAVLDCVKIEADVLRLSIDNGFPWETLATELKTMRLLHRNASWRQKMFSLARILPAAVLPSRLYYQWRRRLSTFTGYKAFRRRFLPFPTQVHVSRGEKAAPRT